MICDAQARLDGQMAALAGRNEYHNPHALRTSQRAAWAKGWGEIKKDRK